MNHLGLLATFVILIGNLWGGALAVGLFLRNRWFAWAVAPALFVTLFFSIETLFYLGSVRWLLLATTVASAALITLSANGWEPASSPRIQEALRRWREDFHPRRLWPVAATFVVFFGYVFMWRYAFPSIDGSSEKLSDLSFLASYQAGGRIPVIDAWLYPFPSVHYYSLQFYGGALAGRMFGWPVGITYNFSFITLVALVSIAFFGALTMLVTRRRLQILAAASFILGGSGAAGIVHLVYQDPQPWNGNRFIGSKPYDAVPYGTWLQEHASKFSSAEVPGEPFAYTIFLGDYHPPLSSFYLIGLCAMAMLLWHRTRQKRYALLTGVSLTWCVLGNTWLFPLQALVVLLWIAWEKGDRKALFGWVVVGGLAVWALTYGFLDPFLAASANYKTSVKLVPMNMHTPPLLFLIYLFPQILIFVTAFYSRHRSGVWIGLTGLFMLACTEFIFIDDVYAGNYDRFNTTLKWWPWIGAAGILAGVWLAEHAGRAFVRWAAVFALAYPCFFGLDILRHWWLCPKPEIGQLEGNGFLTRTEGTRIVLNWLKNEPKGVVVERPNKDSYTNSAALPLFAGHRMWLGWVGHEALWRGYSNDVWQRIDALNRFFAGDNLTAGEWFAVRGVDYVLWYQDEDTNELRERIEPGMQSHYAWKDVFMTPEGKHVGYWVRRSVQQP